MAIGYAAFKRKPLACRPAGFGHRLCASASLDQTFCSAGTLKPRSHPTWRRSARTAHCSRAACIPLRMYELVGRRRAGRILDRRRLFEVNCFAYLASDRLSSQHESKRNGESKNLNCWKPKWGIDILGETPAISRGRTSGSPPRKLDSRPRPPAFP